MAAPPQAIWCDWIPLQSPFVFNHRQPATAYNCDRRLQLAQAGPYNKPTSRSIRYDSRIQQAESYDRLQSQQPTQQQAESYDRLLCNTTAGSNGMIGLQDQPTGPTSGYNNNLQ